MNLTTGSVPVRHFVCDNFIWPRADWTLPTGADAWEIEYANDVEYLKRTTRNPPAWAADVLRQVQDLDVLRHCAHLFGVAAFPDSLLWGGGLQVLAPSGYLAPHLDGAVHPKRPHLRRAVQLVCFCHYDWHPEWGGEFALHDPSGNVLEKFLPLPGRLIAFESSHDLAYHSVLPVTGPCERVSVSASLLTDARECDTRTRALFLPTRTKSQRPPNE